MILHNTKTFGYIEKSKSTACQLFFRALTGRPNDMSTIIANAISLATETELRWFRLVVNHMISYEIDELDPEQCLPFINDDVAECFMRCEKLLMFI